MQAHGAWCQVYYFLFSRDLRKYARGSVGALGSRAGLASRRVPLSQATLPAAHRACLHHNKPELTRTSKELAHPVKLIFI